MKHIFIVLACMGVIACSSVDPYTVAPLSCAEVDAEVKKHNKRISVVNKLGKARDVTVVGSTVVGAVVAGPVGALVGLGAGALSKADIDTTGEEKRVELLWHARDRRMVAGFEGC